jgi:site-specific DNA recombinase
VAKLWSVRKLKVGSFSYYVCGTLLKKGAGSCKARYLNSRKFDEIIINKIKNIS